MQIIPAILATTEQNFVQDLTKIESSRLFDLVHFDFADNKFVQNQTIGVEILQKHPTQLNIEAHLMVVDPCEWVSKLHKVGCKRAIAHIEVEKNKLEDFIHQCQSHHLEIGIAINMETPLEQLQPYLPIVDLVLVMAIQPGFQGQPFIPESIERIKQLSQICSNLTKPIMIGVDGHINSADAKLVAEAGATHLVVGSFLLQGEINENLKQIKTALQS